LKYLNRNNIDVFKRVNDCNFCIEIFQEMFSGNHRVEEAINESIPIFEVLSPTMKPPTKRQKPLKPTSDPFELNPFHPLKDTCMTCLNQEGLVLSCGHSHCETCIIDLHLGDISYILAQIEKSYFTVIPSKFQFKCITADCSERLSFPSALIKSMISSRLESKYLQIFEKISVFFDGIPLEMSKCSCENLVITIRNRKFYCTCQDHSE
jgi:hypothetical protein